MMHTNCTVPYGEVDGMSALLGYQTANAAGCKVLIHPRWGTSVYPATLFTKAPVTVLKKIIVEVEAETTDTGYYQSFMSI